MAGIADQGAAVSAAIQRVVDPVVGRYWRRLSPAQVLDKGHGQLATPADREIEEGLHAALTRLEPGPVVGEESSAELAAVAPGTRWVIDPLDGTRQFAAGSPRFAVAVALLDGQGVAASWVYAPYDGGMSSSGAMRSCAARAASPAAGLVWVTAAEFRTPLGERCRRRLTRAGLRVVELDCVALAYRDVARGRACGVVSDWAKVWDHAPGIGLCVAARGQAHDGEGHRWNPYREPALPLVVTADAKAWGDIAPCLDELSN